MKYDARYYKEKTLKESNFFINEKSSKELSREFDLNVKRLEKILGKQTENYNIYKITYEVMTGQRQAIETNKAFAEKDYTIARLKNMSNTYQEIKILLNAYDTGIITLDELTDKIEYFKKHNLEYMSNYK